MIIVADCENVNQSSLINHLLGVNPIMGRWGIEQKRADYAQGMPRRTTGYEIATYLWVTIWVGYGTNLLNLRDSVWAVLEYW